VEITGLDQRGPTLVMNFQWFPYQKNINKVEELLPGENNTENLIFIRYEGKKGNGRQILQLSLLRSLDRFAEKESIIDESGKTFHFTANGFKHRYGLKLMKAGMSMGQIHQLIANVTSEMPMIYARMIQKNG
jgi:hypothetical protein